MNPHSPITQYFGYMVVHDWIILLVIPGALTILITTIVVKGDIQSTVNFLTTVIPTIASIISGFLGMIIVASLSSNKIFNQMKENPIERRGSFHSEYHVFFNGIYINLLLEMILLFTSIIIGSINCSSNYSDFTYTLELIALLLILLSSSCLFINNMDRLYQVNIDETP